MALLFYIELPYFLILVQMHNDMINKEMNKQVDEIKLRLGTNYPLIIVCIKSYAFPIVIAQKRFRNIIK